MDKKEVN
jgi:ubiquitin-conjugating enzyme E2 I